MKQVPANDAPAALTIYSRQGCHLCEVLIDSLQPIVRGRLPLDVRDIDSRPEWQASYGTRVPVVEYRGQFVCQYTLDRDAVRVILDDLPGS